MSRYFRIHKYDVGKFRFKKIVEKLLDCEDLENIHEYMKIDPPTTRETDQVTPLHELFYSGYENQPSEFLSTYEDFIAYIHRDYECPIVYQARPTFRVHLPGGMAVGEFHKDRDYMHHRKEINYLVPVTLMYGNNSIWIESREDLGDYHPMELRYGEYIDFDGSNLRHGNYRNDSPITRMSFDFRVIPLHQFEEVEGRESIQAHIPMKIGDYYKLYDKP